MIYLYTGTPGSGKSYHASLDIYNKLKRKSKNNLKMNRVIANYFIDIESSDFYHVDNSDLKVDFLEKFAHENHKSGVEGHTLVVIDEAGSLFNSRNWNSQSKERMRWLTFFSQHRKYGYNFILISQADYFIDKQIRGLIEYEVAHMVINNFFSFLPLKSFLAVSRWYGQRMKIGHDIIFLRKKIYKIYNSFGTFITDSSGGDDKERKSVSHDVKVDDVLKNIVNSV